MKRNYNCIIVSHYVYGHELIVITVVFFLQIYKRFLIYIWFLLLFMIDKQKQINEKYIELNIMLFFFILLRIHEKIHRAPGIRFNLFIHGH